MMNMVNVCANAVYSLILCVLIFLTVRKLENSQNRKNFLILLHTVLMFNLTDCFAWAFEGTAPAWKIPALRIITFIYYLAAPIMYIAFMKFLRSILKEKYVNNRLYIMTMIPCFCSVVGSFASCFPGFLYSFTPENAYARNPFYILHVICVFIFYVFSILYIVTNRKQMEKRTFLTVLSFPTLPILGYVPQMFVYGFEALNAGLVGSMIILYVNLKKDIQLGGVRSVAFAAENFKKKERVSFAEKIRRFIFSYGFNDDSIQSIKSELKGNVAYSMQIITVSSGCLTVICFILSLFVPRFAELKFLFLGTAVICCVLAILFHTSGRHANVSVSLGYLFFILIFAAGLYKGLVMSPEESPILFAFALCVAPSVFCDRPYVITLIDYGAVFIYMDLARMYRLPENAASDSMTLFILATLGVIIGYVMAKTKITSIYLTKNLDNEVLVKTKQLNAMSREIVTTLTSSIESKDKYTNGHSRRVADYSVMLAYTLGWSEERCDELWMEAILHDVGKIGVPDSILTKTDKLTDEELKIIQSHTTTGARILKNLESFPEAKDTARYHHEKIDGNGYPEGLKGDAIPAAAKIVAIADAYDAMTTNRSYRPSLSDKHVVEELKKGRGTQFDPVLLDAFLQLLRDQGGSLLHDSDVV